MAKKLKETYIHTHRQTDRLPLVVLSAAVAAKNLRKFAYAAMRAVGCTARIRKQAAAAAKLNGCLHLYANC